ncbi:MAG TPA: L-threonylcarbamoyladenylate synthase [Rhodanobacteraceae bacterium]|nr:L-threonylcarbamoyladenylate synthase [Rhodanobacteraceae bacterium]
MSGADPTPGAAARLQEAAARLRAGGLVAFPTETVYGLGADARNPDAVARIFAAKGRPSDHPLIVHLAHAGQIDDWARQVPEEARRLAAAFWPGPLTLVLPRRRDVPAAVTGGADTIALRAPAHALAQALLGAFGGGIAAPSANRYGRVSPTTAQHVREELGERVDLVLDGGPCRVGIESTIIDLSGGAARLLRPGSITPRLLQRVLGRTVQGAGGNVPSPGRKISHYAPRARVLLADDLDDALRVAAPSRADGLRVGLLATLPPPPTHADLVWIALPRSPRTQARALYACLREADLRALDVLVAVNPPGSGIAAALRDRLRRAAGQGDGSV